MKDFYMADPNQPDLVAELAKLVPGIGGSLTILLMVIRPRNWFEFVTSLLGGATTAYFVGPITAAVLRLDTTAEGLSGAGFLTGALAVAFMPALVRQGQNLVGRWNGSWPPKFEAPKPPEPPKQD